MINNIKNNKFLNSNYNSNGLNSLTNYKKDLSKLKSHKLNEHENNIISWASIKYDNKLNNVFKSVPRKARHREFPPNE